MEAVGVKKARKNVTTWTKEALTTFFEEFETHPCLYDTKSKFYSNKHARADALTKMCNALAIPGLTVEDVRQKINNIRTQISHELKKIRTGRSGDGVDEKYEPLWWFDLAQFFLPHVKSRKAHDSLLDDCSGINADTADSEASSLSLPKELSNSSSPHPTLTTTKKKHDDSDAAFSATLQTLRNLNESLANNLNGKYKEEEFGNFVAKELSEIDDIELLLEAKHEISNLIYHFKKKWIQKVKETTFEFIN